MCPKKKKLVRVELGVVICRNPDSYGMNNFHTPNSVGVVGTEFFFQSQPTRPHTKNSESPHQVAVADTFPEHTHPLVSITTPSHFIFLFAAFEFNSLQLRLVTHCHGLTVGMNTRIYTGLHISFPLNHNHHHLYLFPTLAHRPMRPPSSQ